MIETERCLCGNVFTPWFQLDGTPRDHRRDWCGFCREEWRHNFRGRRTFGDPEAASTF